MKNKSDHPNDDEFRVQVCTRVEDTVRINERANHGSSHPYTKDRQSNGIQGRSGELKSLIVLFFSKSQITPSNLIGIFPQILAPRCAIACPFTSAASRTMRRKRTAVQLAESVKRGAIQPTAAVTSYGHLEPNLPDAAIGLNVCRCYLPRSLHLSVRSNRQPKSHADFSLSPYCCQRLV